MPVNWKDFWEFLNTDVREIPWNDVAEQGVNAVVAMQGIGKAFQDQAPKISQLQAVANEVTPFLSILDAPIVDLGLSTLPIIPVGIGLLRLYLSSKIKEPSFEETVILVTQLAYLKSLKLNLEVLKNESLEETLSKISLTELLKTQSSIFNERQFQRTELENSLETFQTSQIALLFEEAFKEILDNDETLDEKDETGVKNFLEKVKWGTHRFLNQAIFELRDDIKSLEDFINLNSRLVRNDRKYNEIDQYLEGVIKEQPNQQVFDEDNPSITFSDLYVQLKVISLDFDGKPLEDIEPIDSHQWVKDSLNSDYKRGFKGVLLLEGSAGQGKTVFCKMLANYLLEAVYPIYIPIIIKLRDLQSLGNNLTETLENHFEEFYFIQSESGWMADKNTRFLFIFDGFDELLIEGYSDGGTRELLSQIQKIKHHKFIVTGRPLALQSIRLPQTINRFKLEPMDDSLQDKWIQNWAKKVGIEESEKLQRFLQLCPEDIKDNLAREPLLLYLIAKLHRERKLSIELFHNKQDSQAKALVYDEAVKWVLERQRQNENVRLSGLASNDLRQVLQEAALCIVQSGNEVIELSVLENRFQETDNPVSKLIAYAVEETNQTQKKVLNSLLATFYLKPGSTNQRGTIEFSHKSFCEFLFAEYLSIQLNNISSSVNLEFLSENEKKNLARQIYNLFGYGQLTLDIVDNLMVRIFSQPNKDIKKIFSCIRNFYEDWCFGEYIDKEYPDNFPQNNMPRLYSLKKQVGLRQIDIYSGLNALILLLRIHHFPLNHQEHSIKFDFHPCFRKDYSGLDPKLLFRIVGYSYCIGLSRFTGNSDAENENEDFPSAFFSSMVGPFLSFSNLEGSYLATLNLSSVNLSNADLRNANLSGINLCNSNLSNANLSGADLSGANLTSINLSDAILEGAILEGAILEGADLSDANCKDTDFRKADLSSVDLSGSDFENALLREADLNESDLRTAKFLYADLTDADLSGTDLSDANFSSAQLQGVDLSKADLRNGIFSSAYFAEANLRDADIRQANLSDAILAKSNLRDSDLRSAVVKGSDLSQADLRHADLRGADLRQANLKQANLRHSKLKNANIGYADFKEISYNKDTSWDAALEKDNARNLPKEWRDQLR